VVYETNVLIVEREGIGVEAIPPCGAEVVRQGLWGPTKVRWIHGYRLEGDVGSADSGLSDS